FVPGELPPAVADLLPPLPVIEPPAPHLGQLLPGLRLMGESYAQRIAAISLIDGAAAHPMRARQRAFLIDSLAAARSEMEPLLAAARQIIDETVQATQFDAENATTASGGDGAGGTLPDSRQNAKVFAS